MTTAMMRSGAALGVLVLLGLASAAALPVHAGTPALTTPSVTAPSVTAPSVTTPTVKTPSVPTTATSTCGTQLKMVKSALKKAPAGPTRDQAKTHYDSAVAANKTHDDKTCLSELDAASALLK